MENMEVKTSGDHIVAQALETALDSKVEKEEGKGLSSNDYTDADKEKLTGIPVLDYTSLEEQVVPGEFWFGHDGVRRQVYARAFIGEITNSIGETRLLLLSGVSSLLWCSGFVLLVDNSRGYLSNAAYVDYKDIISVDFQVTSANANRPYYAYCKYTKV